MKINCNTTKQNDLKWRKTCTGLKFDLVHFYGPQTKFIVDSLYKHPVYGGGLIDPPTGVGQVKLKFAFKNVNLKDKDNIIML